MMTYEEKLQAMLDRVPSNVDKREGSVIYDALAPSAYFLTQQTFQLDNFIDLVLADTAVGEYLDRAISPSGVSRKAATAAVRKMTTSGPVDPGSRWGIGGLVYVVTAKTGDYEYEAECQTEGEIGNWYSGSIQPLSMSGVTAELTDIIAAGSDEESDEALRERFYLKVRLPATSGNAYHYKLWAMEVAGVGDAKVFPLDDGPGTITVLIVNANKRRDPALEKAVWDYIESVRPIGAAVTVSSPEEIKANITADVLLDGTRRKEDVLGDFKEAVDSYLKSLVFSNYRVSYAKIGNLLLDIDGVDDYNDLKLNGGVTNIAVPPKGVPALGDIGLSEVSTFGIN